MKKAFYPPLIAAFLVLALFNANSHQIVSASVVGFPLLISVGGACTLWTLGRLIFGSWSRAALPTCVLTIMLLEYGHFRGVLGLKENTTVMLWVATLTMTALVAAIIKRPPTKVFNAMAIGLTLVALVPFCLHIISIPTFQPRSTDSTLEATYAPDIYYIVIDEYSRDDVLLNMCNFDNSEFTDYLRGKGFYVADASYSSYPATLLYLASFLSMDYLPLKTNVAETSNLIYNSEVYKQLERLDYTTIHICSWWYVTKSFKDVDISYIYGKDNLSDFSRLFRNMTPFQDISEVANNERLYNCIRYQFDQLTKVPRMSEPTFTFAHITITHAPYLFNPDGSLRDNKHIPPIGRMHMEPYIDQIKAANKLLQKTIDTILAKGDAIIILQSDTGTQPLNLLPYLSEHNEAFDNVMQEEPYVVEARLANLSAIYPDIGYELISPANTFRIIFNYYFGANYEILPDRQFFTRRIYAPPFNMFEVTDDLKEYRNRQ